MRMRAPVAKIAYLCLILILVLLMIFSGLRILESAVFSNQNPTETVSSRVILRDGVRYYPKQDITVLLVMGIDRFGKMESSGSYNNDGAADMVSIVVFDEGSKTCNILCLNRDTIVDMPVLGVGGKEAGTIRQQLALSHTYGTGLEDSCLNTCKTVSEFLYGLQIDHYISMNMDAIAVLNDAVGGVTVNVTDDFSGIDSSIPMGSVALKGQQAIHFVRTRKDMGDQTNVSRMERQKQYMDGFLTAFRDKLRENSSFVMSAYQDVAEYMLTDTAANVLSGLLDRYKDYTVADVISPQGQTVLDGEYLEFHVDEEALDALILRLFYAPR